MTTSESRQPESRINIGRRDAYLGESPFFSRSEADPQKVSDVIQAIRLTQAERNVGMPPGEETMT